MSLSELEGLAVLSRTFTYIATILLAGAVLFRLSVSGARELDRVIRLQIHLSTALLLLSEIARYLIFQLKITGGDYALAFHPSMRWMAFETAIGHAMTVRVLAAAVILAVGLRWPWIAGSAALFLISSYLFEGHTVSHSESILMSLLLFLHLATVHWWIGSLTVLRAATNRLPDEPLAVLMTKFGWSALGAVVLLFGAGGALLGTLTGWELGLSSSYQQAFAIKLALFLGIILIAAANKFAITPLLRRAPSRGRNALRLAISVEIVIAISIVVATAPATSFSPG